LNTALNKTVFFAAMNFTDESGGETKAALTKNIEP
jgi:hypothetical protein